MATFASVLRDAEKTARRAGKEASAIKQLLLHHSGMTPSELYVKLDTSMKEDAHQAFLLSLSRYVDQGEPVQYILGYVSFYGYRFLVGPDVLIPRFETEELVANVLIAYDEVFAGKPARLVDIGTGSGCLAIALKLEEPNLVVTATDISEAAIQTAKDNAKALHSDVEFLVGDMLSPLQGRMFDILVSNPPYIPAEEVVDPIIRDHEPHVALFGGEDGLRFYRIILSGAKSIVADTCILAFEHAYHHGEAIRQLAKEHFPDAECVTLRDMQGKERMTIVKQTKRDQL
jgi:release factor glutamine methyltransferase